MCVLLGGGFRDGWDLCFDGADDRMMMEADPSPKLLFFFRHGKG